MSLNPVSSSNVAAIGWSDGVLHVRFHGGRLYEYVGVPSDVFDAFMSAPSKGRFLHWRIARQYHYIRLE